jgi:hypothetical protein
MKQKWPENKSYGINYHLAVRRRASSLHWPCKRRGTAVIKITKSPVLAGRLCGTIARCRYLRQYSSLSPGKKANIPLRNTSTAESFSRCSSARWSTGSPRSSAHSRFLPDFVKTPKTIFLLSHSIQTAISLPGFAGNFAFSCYSLNIGIKHPRLNERTRVRAEKETSF